MFFNILQNFLIILWYFGRIGPVFSSTSVLIKTQSLDFSSPSINFKPKKFPFTQNTAATLLSNVILNHKSHFFSLQLLQKFKPTFPFAPKKTSSGVTSKSQRIKTHHFENYSESSRRE